MTLSLAHSPEKQPICHFASCFSFLYSIDITRTFLLLLLLLFLVRHLVSSSSSHPPIRVNLSFVVVYHQKQQPPIPSSFPTWRGSRIDAPKARRPTGWWGLLPCCLNFFSLRPSSSRYWALSHPHNSKDLSHVYMFWYFLLLEKHVLNEQF